MGDGLGTVNELGQLRDRVVVGVDGSPGSDLALSWAVANQASLGPITPVAVYHVDALVDGVGTASMYEDMIDLLRRDAEARVTEAGNRHPDAGGPGYVVQGYPGPALVRAAGGQRLLVVGSRGRSALAETLLGSVASYCVKHAPIPVAVIPPGTVADAPLTHLVVGVDGSTNADAALAWAAEHVTPGGRITAVVCKAPGPYALELIPPQPMETSELRSVGEKAVARSIGEVDATVEVEVLHGDPRVVLRDRADEADLLVVGARGHRGAAYLLLGSVTTSLSHHPTVPTVVVPAESTD